MQSVPLLSCLFLLCVLVGCTEREGVRVGEEELAATNEVVARIIPQDYVDSAQVFFFRLSGDSDTLIHHEVVYQIEYQKPRDFHFNLPAGNYKMWVYGNVPTGCIVAKLPYSSSDFILDYSDGRKPGAVCYGLSRFSVGTDTVKVSGMLFLTAFVELTIKSVPAGISSIVVKLLGSASGVTFNNGFVKEAMDPPLSDTLYHVEKDSTYFSAFYCFPGVPPDYKITLEVSCINSQGQVVYSGQSSPFDARYGYQHKIACSFAPTVLQSRGREWPGHIYFEEPKE